MLWHYKTSETEMQRSHILTKIFYGETKKSFLILISFIIELLLCSRESPVSPTQVRGEWEDVSGGCHGHGVQADSL